MLKMHPQNLTYLQICISKALISFKFEIKQKEGAPQAGNGWVQKIKLHLEKNSFIP